MSRMRRLTGAVLLALALMVAACGGEAPPPPEEVIIGGWKIAKMDQGGMSPPLNILMQSSFTFGRDGRYEILLGELERGTWKLNEGATVLITTPDGGREQMIDIVQLDSTRLVLENTQAQPSVRIELVPAKNWSGPEGPINMPPEMQPTLAPPGDSGVQAAPGE